MCSRHVDFYVALLFILPNWPVSKQKLPMQLNWIWSVTSRRTVIFYFRVQRFFLASYLKQALTCFKILHSFFLPHPLFFSFPVYAYGTQDIILTCLVCYGLDSNPHPPMSQPVALPTIYQMLLRPVIQEVSFPNFTKCSNICTW